MLTFDPVEHRYFLDGQEVPGVTSILRPLQNFSGIDPAVLRAKADLGTAVHKAAELDDADDLDEDSVDPAVAPYLKAWRKFRAETGARILHSERQLGSRALRFAGTLDRVAILPRLTQSTTWLLDLKTSTQIDAWVGVQLAAYRLLLEEADESVDALGAVQLLPDGRYKLHPFKHPDDSRCFVALLTVHHWRCKNV